MASRVSVAIRIPFLRIIIKSPHARNKAFFQKLSRAKWLANRPRMSNAMLGTDSAAFFRYFDVDSGKMKDEALAHGGDMQEIELAAVIQAEPACRR
jgi:hypothetical protein